MTFAPADKRPSSNGQTITKNNEDSPDSSGWSASLYNKTASFVYSADFVAPVLSLLNVKPGERILDLGCGSGEVTLAIEKVVTSQGQDGLVVGVDASESMIHKARANGLQRAFIADAQDLRVPEEIFNLVGDAGFDAVFSNATLHWCKRDPLGVLKGAKRVLKPGGRLVVEMGGFMNCIGVRSAIHAAIRARGYDPLEHDPWYFPSIEDYGKMAAASPDKPEANGQVSEKTPNGTVAKGQVGEGQKVTVKDVAPTLIDFSLVLSLVFGGCCSNVLAYEKLLLLNPRIGSALTFSQMFFVTLQTLPAFLTFSPNSFIPTLKPRQVPLQQWALQVIVLTTGSLLNNWAYAYKVPLTVLIVFRSASLPISILFGMLFLKRKYNLLQIVSGPFTLLTGHPLTKMAVL
ncbi:hypothetical protein EST38_g2998 [Candolleomyces aberdarensis]|uniref:Methyltransferase domain-containing protein n=1 Tax=Candolleomyces aberdarensis TaxID=2316362 RepID=A0A4Q2DUR9_9AGAR|nr:hypothetical protein EST38_g2998 [Candolleomyces aberdarensis]